MNKEPKQEVYWTVSNIVGTLLHISIDAHRVGACLQLNSPDESSIIGRDLDDLEKQLKIALASTKQAKKQWKNFVKAKQ